MAVAVLHSSSAFGVQAAGFQTCNRLQLIRSSCSGSKLLPAWCATGIVLLHAASQGQCMLVHTGGQMRGTPSIACSKCSLEWLIVCMP